MSRLLYVHVAGTPGEVEDIEVPGIYEIEVDASVPEEHHVSAVLDEFHRRVAIGELDDFEISVRTESGEVLVESAAEKPEGLRASFNGKISDQPGNPAP